MHRRQFVLAAAASPILTLHRPKAHLSRHVSRTDLSALAWIIWGEARGEPLVGQVAVAQTVLNRVRRTDKMFARDTSILAACRRPGQYSCWTERRHPLDSDMLNLASEAVSLYHEGQDVTLGSTHYHTLGLHESWEKVMVPTVRIGRHQFYKALKEA